MPFETQYRLSATHLRAALYITGGLSLLLLVYAAFRKEIEPFWLPLAAAVPVLLLVLVRKVPVALMVALAYVGNFKPHAALGISVTDPTLVVVALLYAGVFLELLLVDAGFDSLLLSVFVAVSVDLPEESDLLDSEFPDSDFESLFDDSPLAGTLLPPLA